MGLVKRKGLVFDHIHNYYQTNIRDKSLVVEHPKPRWQIIYEARRDLKGYLPQRFIEQSGNSLDFARL